MRGQLKSQFAIVNWYQCKNLKLYEN